jgi:Transposase IS116/IS110/IS902 family
MARPFRRGRDFAAWLGVVPRQYSTGGKQKLFGIRQAGQHVFASYADPRCWCELALRVKYHTGGLGQWVHRLAQRAPHNKVVVAIANKLARIAWAVLSGAAGTTNISRCSGRQLDGRGKDAALGKHRTLSTFPPPRRGFRVIPTVC